MRICHGPAPGGILSKGFQMRKGLGPSFLLLVASHPKHSGLATATYHSSQFQGWSVSHLGSLAGLPSAGASTGLGGPDGLTAVSGGWCWLPAGHLHSLLHQDAMGQLLLHLVDQLSDPGVLAFPGGKGRSSAISPVSGSETHSRQLPSIGQREPQSQSRCQEVEKWSLPLKGRMTRYITEEPMFWEGWTLDSLSQTDG